MLGKWPISSKLSEMSAWACRAGGVVLAHGHLLTNPFAPGELLEFGAAPRLVAR